MIKSFKCRETEKIFYGWAINKFPPDILKRALIRLHSIDIAYSINDLRNPPSNHLEVLKGDRQGYYSLRINAKWRNCFFWCDNNAFEVEIIDYH